MKDASVSPAGLFDPRRQKRLLEGIADRFRSCLDQQKSLRSQHAIERDREEEQFSHERAEVTNRCRAQRREMLEAWDNAEEDLTSGYESTAIQNRKELNRLAALFRKKAAEETKNVERKVEARRQAVLQQYETHKNQPGLQNRKQIKTIDDSLTTIHAHLEQARELAIQRLSRIPEVTSEDRDDDLVSQPESVDETIRAIEKMTADCRAAVEEMQAGAGSKKTALWLFGGVGLLIAAWLGIAWLAFPYDPPAPMWQMLAGTVVLIVIGFVTHTVLQWPVNKLTRRLHPRVEQIASAAETCAARGRKLSTVAAKEMAAELVQRRDSHLAAADRWQQEQLEEMEARLRQEQQQVHQNLLAGLAEADRRYVTEFETVGTEMRRRAETLAAQITQDLAETDRALQEKRETGATQRHEQLQYLATRLKDGASRSLARILNTETNVRKRFPEWDQVLAGSQPDDRNLDYLPLGWLQVDASLRSVLESGTQTEPEDAEQNGHSPRDLADLLADAKIPDSLPVVLHRRLHSGVVIQAPPAQVDQAIELAHQILWRLMSGAAPSRAKLTLIDPLGRGQHFTSFMAFADHDPTLVGHRVWTTDSKIDARLGELAHHMEDVLQSSLRDRFERIEDYNEVAGSMAEPYRAVAAVGLPEGLTRDGYKHLRALVESGLRCGVFTVLVCDSTKSWPSDMPLPATERLLHLSIDDSGKWQLDSDGLEGLPFQPAQSPPLAMRNQLVEQIGQAAVAASRVEIPLGTILAKVEEAKGSTDDGIEIAIGSQGANRSLSLELGEGVRQHVLIAGKTGSGKSTLLHSIISSAAYRYRPDQMQFYLLDFKKGVEFKPYAESGLPHARVIGIESEREFGRSVLQRLDEELQQRGERFRAHNVQELSHFRDFSGEQMPRIMLVIDEFQELFVRDDRLAGDCAMLLDRLVRQGRSFGMHVILSSQSLAGAYSLPRATLGQMAVRIAMHCSESDAALILSDDNTAARLISRPGEAIYNDAGGLIEGNQPFQVAWLSSSKHQEMLTSISERDRASVSDLAPPVIFEGNRPCRWSPGLAAAAIAGEGSAIKGLLGESVEIGPPLALELSPNTGRNVLIITPPESRGAVLGAALSGLAKSDPRLEVVYLDGNRPDDAPTLAPWLNDSGIPARCLRPRDGETEIARLAQLIKERGDEATDVAPIVAVIDPLERFRDFRQDESFNFSLDAAASGTNAATMLQEVLRDGPSANVHLFVVCGSAETLSRWLPRGSQHDLELCILGRMNAQDSSKLIDTPMAADLSAATMLLYDDSDGRIAKFRQCDLPDAAEVRDWLRV